jgi:hypothetical protein
MQDFAALARQFGGSVAPATNASPGGPDYAALAKQFGGDESLPTVSEDGRVQSSNAVDEQGRSVVRDFIGELHTLHPSDWAKGLSDAFWAPARLQTEAAEDFKSGNIGEGLKKTAIGAMGPVGPIVAGAFDDNIRVEAQQAFEAGDYVTGSRKLINWLIPFLGKRMDEAGDLFAEGEYVKGTAATTDVALASMGPAALKNVKDIKLPGVAKPQNPAEAAAVEFGLKEGVPVDMGTATGNRFVKGTQRLNDGTALGSGVAERATQAQGEALTATGQKLANQAKSSPVTAEQAGESIRRTVEASATRLNEAATKAYDKLRALEAKANPETKTVGFDPKTGAAATEPIKLGVNVGAVKDQLLPLYKDLLRERELVGTMQGKKGTTLKALDTLMQGPEWAPLSAVDAALGDLKALSRTDGIPALRTPGQATAAQAVSALEREVQAAAARGGPEVVRALSEGRAFTRQKYAVAEILDDLTAGGGGEPVRIVKKLTANQDTAIAKLKALEKVAPQELPNLGRVVLDELLERATKEGGFTKAQGILADWQKLGAETKSLLFGKPEYIRDLDNFFLLAKKLGENPNPSGTALTLTQGGELTLAITTGGASLPASIGAGVLAKLMHSPKVVKALVRGLQVPVGNRGAAAAATNSILTAAKEAGVSLAPATDENDPRGIQRDLPADAGSLAPGAARNTSATRPR